MTVVGALVAIGAMLVALEIATAIRALAAATRAEKRVNWNPTITVNHIQQGPPEQWRVERWKGSAQPDGTGQPPA